MTVSEHLKSVCLFASLTEAERKRLASVCRHRTYRGRTHLFYKDDTDNQLYIVLSGGVKIYYNEPFCGQEVTLALYAAGGVFGETSLLGGGTRPASAVTIAEQTELLLLDQADLMNALSNDFSLTQALMKNMAQRLEGASGPTEPQWQETVSVRVAKLLLARAEKKTGLLNPALTQGEMAQMIGTRRETVARNLAKLENLGCLQRNHGDICITNRAKLHAAVGAI